MKRVPTQLVAKLPIPSIIQPYNKSHMYNKYRRDNIKNIPRGIFITILVMYIFFEILIVARGEIEGHYQSTCIL